jgi:hypothetical protein
MTLPLSRRDFLHAAALAGAGVALDRPAAAQTPVDAAIPATEAPRSSQFAVQFEDGAIVSLKRVDDAFDTDYVQTDRRLGDAIVRYRHGNSGWQTLDTAEWAGERAVSASDDGSTHGASYRVKDGGTPILGLTIGFIVEDEVLRWNVGLTNLTSQPLEIGDLAIPLPMNSSFRQQPTTAVLKHSFISGDGSFLFWMRRNSVGPYLTMTPAAGTKLEYWESQGGYRVFMHSVAAGAAARERGTAWRQPHTSVTLAPGGEAGATRDYGFALHWAPDYDGVRRILLHEGLIDTHVVPGMTVPADLGARIALRTTQRITAVEAEHPEQTHIRSLGTTGSAAGASTPSPATIPASASPHSSPRRTRSSRCRRRSARSTTTSSTSSGADCSGRPTRSSRTASTASRTGSRTARARIPAGTAGSTSGGSTTTRTSC